MTTLLTPLRAALLLTFLLLTFLLLAGARTPLSAQDPGSGGPQPGNPDPTAVPIDGGAALLLAGGAAYALRRLRPRR